MEFLDKGNVFIKPMKRSDLSAVMHVVLQLLQQRHDADSAKLMQQLPA
jgi:hypothetical protein